MNRNRDVRVKILLRPSASLTVVWGRLRSGKESFANKCFLYEAKGDLVTRRQIPIEACLKEGKKAQSVFHGDSLQA